MDVYEKATGISRWFLGLGALRELLKYLHHLMADVPPELGPLTPADFRLSRLRYVEPRPYPVEEFERTYHWMRGWGLVPEGATYESLVDNRVGV